MTIKLKIEYSIISDVCSPDLTMLIQPLASQAINATSRSKADLVLKIACKFYIFI